jgi:hypothetical protein
MPSLDEIIGQDLRDSEAELRASPAFGRPLPDDGYFEAPPELRMAFKVLRNAGAVPPEVALMQELQALRDRLAALPTGDAQVREVRARITDLELTIAMRVERLARTRSL